jgi:hypothetical protein
MELLGLRMRGHTRVDLVSTLEEDEDDVSAIDFSNAVSAQRSLALHAPVSFYTPTNGVLPCAQVLYVGGIQAVSACVCTAVTSIVCCTMLPPSLVSAVRTLVLSSVVGAALLRKPFRLGRVHGLLLVFRALQPVVPIYVGALIVEQLTHACARDLVSPSWRKLVFFASTGLMIVSGFMRARRPLANTDLPFLLTCVALLAVAMLPPPAVLLSGPLCSLPTLYAAAERLTRAVVFSLLYATFVYAAAPPVQSSPEVLICVARASAASVWVLAAHLYLLPLAALQLGVVVFVRVFSAEYEISDESSYSPVPIQTPPSTDDIESTPATLAPIEQLLPDVVPVEVPGHHTNTISSNSIITPTFPMLGARGAVDIGARGSSDVSAADMAAIAARLEAED